MTNQSPARTLLFLLAIFVLTELSQVLLAPLETKLYDHNLTLDHDWRYGGHGKHPALRLLVHSEETDEDFGTWTKTQTDELNEFLLSNNAAAVVYHPNEHEELIPTPRERVFLLDDDKTSPFLLDGDGVCREALLAVETEGEWSPTLPLRVLSTIEGVSLEDIVYSPDDQEIRLGSRVIETGPDFRISVRFRRSEEAHSIGLLVEDAADAAFDALFPFSMGEFFLQREDRKDFCPGSIVLVGAGFKEAEGQLKTPLGDLTSFKASACVLDTLLNEWSLERLSRSQQALFDLVIIILCYGIFIRLPVGGILAAWVFCQVGWLSLTDHFFGYQFHLRYVPVLVGSTLLACYVINQKLEQARSALKRFGGMGALEAAARGDESVFEDVREKTATIVFTNVPAFLKKLERYGSPDDFFEKRQAYAQLLSDVFRSHGGVVLDFQGDFQMLGFNVELRTDDNQHPLHAVRASQQFLQRVKELGETWTQGGAVELGPVSCGLCTGPVACGHVGSRGDAGRIAQAAIGDTSNVAARLLGAALKQKEPIIMARTTYEASVGDLEVEMLEAVALKGKTERVPICRPIQESGAP